MLLWYKYDVDMYVYCGPHLRRWGIGYLRCCYHQKGSVLLGIIYVVLPHYIMCSLKAHRRLGLYYTPPRGLLKSQATLINLYYFEWEIIHQMDHFSNSVKGNTVELNTISVELCGFLQFSCVTRI